MTRICCAAHSVISLDALLHHCPPLLEKVRWDLDNETLFALLATYRGIRSQVSSALHFQHLVRFLLDTSLMYSDCVVSKKLY